MATISPVDSGIQPNYEILSLTRLLTRLQENLLEADAATEVRLRNSIHERSRLRNNISYAQNVLIQLERDALGLAAQSKRQDVQAELIQKHDLLKQLSEKLQEWEELANEDEYSSEEDILGDDTPSGSVEAEPPSLDSLAPQDPPPIDTHTPVEPQPEPQTTTMSDRDKLFAFSTLRSRHSHLPGRTDIATTTGSQVSSTMAESLLTENRTEQEAITMSLLSMAQQLRESTQTFSSSLESEKDILNRATTGLEQNVTGMEAAQGRMGFLRRMTEGKGWLDRMMLYAWIFGLMFVALSIVLFLPKLRF